MFYAAHADSLQCKKTIFNVNKSRSRTAAWSLQCRHHELPWCRISRGCSSALPVTACTRKPRLQAAFSPFFSLACFSEMGSSYDAQVSVKLLGTNDPCPSASSFTPLKAPAATTKTARDNSSSSSSQQSVSREALPPSGLLDRRPLARLMGGEHPAAPND